MAKFIDRELDKIQCQRKNKIKQKKTNCNFYVNPHMNKTFLNVKRFGNCQQKNICKKWILINFYVILSRGFLSWP